MIYGGLCVTNNSKLAKKLIAIRNNGVNSEPENARLDYLQRKDLILNQAIYMLLLH